MLCNFILLFNIKVSIVRFYTSRNIINPSTQEITYIKHEILMFFLNIKDLFPIIKHERVGNILQDVAMFNILRIKIYF